MKAMGIDPSTRTGLVRLDVEPDRFNNCSLVSSMVVEFPHEKGIHRLRLIADAVQEKLEAWQPDVVVIEGYGFANKFTLSLMVEIGCLIRMKLYERGTPWYIAPPSVLKKYATGHGNSKKSQVAAAVRERWGFDSPSNDVVDAYVLAQIALELGVKGVSTGLKGLERG